MDQLNQDIIIHSSKAEKKNSTATTTKEDKLELNMSLIYCFLDKYRWYRFDDSYVQEWDP